MVCKKTYSLLQKEDPAILNNVGHLARHLKVTHSVRADDLVVRDLEEVYDPSTCDFEFGQSNPGRNSSALAIKFCQDVVNTTSPHDPCVPEYLQTDNDATNSFAEVVPSYPSGANYNVYTALLSDSAWNGCQRDRTAPAAAGQLLKNLIELAYTIIVGDTFCDAFGDDIEIV